MSLEKKHIAGVIILLCALTAIVWQAAGLIASQPRDGFELTADDFDSFALELDGWHVERMPVVATHLEPNILNFHLRGQGDLASVRILVRLVHGFNMRDCMRIKGYNVDLVDGTVSGYRLKVRGSEEENALTNNQELITDNRFRNTQLWRVTSGAGDSSLWMSGVLMARDFSETGGDIRDMPFPRVGVPDDPNWIPRGLTWKSMRHPLKNFGYFIRSKWNSSRCDLLTFLGLRRPAWASEDLLTFLVVWGGPATDDHDKVCFLLSDVYKQVVGQLQDWRFQGHEPYVDNTDRNF